MSPPPAPCRSRRPTSAGMVGANAAAVPEIVNTATAQRNICLVPIASTRGPAMTVATPLVRR